MRENKFTHYVIRASEDGHTTVYTFGRRSRAEHICDKSGVSRDLIRSVEQDGPPPPFGSENVTYESHGTFTEQDPHLLEPTHERRYKRQIESVSPLTVSVSGTAGKVTLFSRYPYEEGSFTSPATESAQWNACGAAVGPLFYLRTGGEVEMWAEMDTRYRMIQAPNKYSVLSWDGAHYVILEQGIDAYDCVVHASPDMASEVVIDKITRYADSGRGAYIAPDYSVVPTGRDMTDRACPGCPRCGRHLPDSEQHPEGTWMA